MWRRRMQDLARGVGRAHPPLFAPVLFGVAAQIEAISADAMSRDATRLRKNVSELRQILHTDAVFCAAPRGAEAAVLAAAWPDVDAVRWTADERTAASLGAVHQWQADASEPVIVAALTGPATLCAQLRGAGDGIDEETGLDSAGRALALLVRLYCEAGVHVVQVHEALLPPAAASDYWKGALGTIGNVARFHRVPPLLVVDHPGPLAWPAQMVAVPAAAQQPGPLPRPHGRAWERVPAEWPVPTSSSETGRVVTTVGEVPEPTGIPLLLAAVQRVRSAWFG